MTFIKFPLPTTGKDIFVALAHIVAVRPSTFPNRCYLVLSNDPDDWHEIAMSQEDVMDTLGRAQDIKVWRVG